MTHHKKILHFHPNGRMATQFILPLIEAEQSAGHKSLLVTDRNPWEKSLRIGYDITPNNLIWLPFAFIRILRVIWELRPDVIISHNSKSSLLPLLAARMMQVSSVVYFNHGVPYVGYRGILRWLLRTLERWNGVLATHVVTVSKDMLALLQDVSPSSKAQVIKNGSASGIDLYAFSPERYSRADWRKAHGLRDEDLIVVYVGRPERRKGFELVLRLWADHFREAAHIKLVLCGPGQDDVLKCLGSFPPNVISLGFINNVPEVLACSDLMILPSLHEGLSYACMEAQASGAVVVANDISGIRCVIENGISGFLVPDNTPSKYIEIIQQVDKDRTALSDIRRRARISVEQYSRKLFIPAYLAFLRALMQK